MAQDTRAQDEAVRVIVAFADAVIAAAVIFELEFTMEALDSGQRP
jgi:hypothetical protein